MRALANSVRSSISSSFDSLVSSKLCSHLRHPVTRSLSGQPSSRLPEAPAAVRGATAPPVSSAQPAATACRPRSVRAMASAANGSGGATEVAILGGGCFWCIETCYNDLQGVISAVSGYAGGHVANPTYEQVCGKKTGHAEVVEVTFDPSKVTFTELLEIFFTMHDPTTKDRQGNDVGPQYRSCILYTSPEQKAAAEEVMARVAAEKWYNAPLVTELVAYQPEGAAKFWPAERYHQGYFNDNPQNPYCAFVVAPKVSKFRSKFLARLKK